LRAASPTSKSAEARLIFKDAAGRELTTDDLKDVSGSVRWEVVGAERVPEEASLLHQQGRAAGGNGDYDTAHKLFDRAHELAPEWPYPVYDKAFTYLLQGDAVKAEQSYAEVDRMVPRGFFTVKRSLDCLRRERAGNLPPGFCQAFATLEWMQDREQKKAILEAIVEKTPALPAAWKDLSTLLDDDEAKERAIARGLEHEPDPDTKGMLLSNQAMLLNRRGDRDGAVKILGTLALDPASTLSTEMLAKASLAFIER